VFSLWRKKVVKRPLALASLILGTVVLHVSAPAVPLLCLDALPDCIPESPLPHQLLMLLGLWPPWKA
jgi:hypothetical protein